MNICALDIATATGFAYSQSNDFVAGTWKLASAKEVAIWGKDRSTRRKDPRVERLCENLTRLPQFDIIVIEDVQFATYRKQAQLWPALRSAVWLCGKAKHFDAVDVQTLKKFAGHGGADKAAMSALLKRQHPELWRAEYDDNAIDAIWIFKWAEVNLSRTCLVK